MSVRIALAGNPNCGKTTLFNRLTGANQYVGNWPGVTVEKKEGKLRGKYQGEDIIVTDLPGIYSLSPYTLEEVVSRDYLLKEHPEVIVDLVDATNIERNLYLTTQLIETGIPVVVALNMADLLDKRNIRINTDKLGRELGCKVVSISALKGTGLEELMDTAIAEGMKLDRKNPAPVFGSDVEEAVSAVEAQISDEVPDEERRWYAVKLIENDSKIGNTLDLAPKAFDVAAENRNSLESAADDDIESIITNERYQYIKRVVGKTVKLPVDRTTISDKIDRVVTNRILGLPIFILIMFGVYYVSITTVGTMMTDWVNDVFVPWVQSGAAAGLQAAGASDLLTSLLVDGVIGGLGAVLGFTPQMAVLFLCLSILEDCGYMVRIAFVMDRIFRHFGLSGKSFIPLLISSGCGVPGIMASKTIEQDNDRRLTIMTATFIPCGAKLPVIALMGGVITSYAVTGDYTAGGFIAPLMYFIGIAAVLVSAIILKKTKPFSGEPAPFVMELPQYHIPEVRTILLHVWERLKSFLIKAGTILFLATIVMWFLASFGVSGGHFGLVDDSSDSILAVIGGAIAPIFAPLGFGEWQPVAASISGFTAKESIVSTMGVLANAGSEEDVVLIGAAIAAWFPNAVAAFSFLLFNLLDSPCFAAIGTIASEMNDRKWFWFAIIYQNVFAYTICLMVYQLGLWFTTGAFSGGTIVGIIILAIYLYLLFRPDPYKERRLHVRRSVSAA